MNLDPSAIIASLLSTLGILLPGAAVLAWQRRRRGIMEMLAVSFGLGMAIIALAALAGRITGIRFSLPILIALESCSAILLGIGLARRAFRFRFTAFTGLEILALLILLGLRFYQARDLALPAWVDSIHHAFVVRLILDGGGIPANLGPWIPGPFYYHFGFHASAAVSAAFSGLPPDTAILVFGQILNAAAALSVYRLSMALRMDRRRALLAMALVGFFAQMPAFYLSWGRYTLLAGMVLLPLAMAEAVAYAVRAPRTSPARESIAPGNRRCSSLTRFADMFDPKNQERDPTCSASAGGGRATAVRLAILTAGVLLTHYLAGILLAVFLVLLGAYVLIRSDRRKRFAGLAVSVGAGTAMALPWLIPMLRYSSGSVGVDVVSWNDSIDVVYFANYAGYLWKLLGPVRNYLMLGAGLIAALAALFRRGPLRIFALWGLVLAVQTLPWGMRVEPFRPDHLAIVLFLPAAVLTADGFLSLAEGAERRVPALRPRFFFAGAALACCLVGIWQTRTIVNPATILADSDDRRAAGWVEENTPPDSIFLINTVPWQNGLYRGTDGGWWLIPLTYRRTLLPPMLYSFADRTYVDQMNSLAAEVSEVKGCTENFRSLVREQGVTHLYIKEGFGSLQPADLESCPGVEEIFRIGKVRIYRVDSAP